MLSRALAVFACSILPFAALGCGSASTPDGGGAGCTRDGDVYAVGQTASSCGEECTCQSDGTFDCVAVPTFAPCGESCTFDGQTYEPGDTRGTCGESCECQTDGSWSCVQTDEACGCVYEGEFHEVGSSFPEGDGCNTCSCDLEGGAYVVGCTLLGCPGNFCLFDGMRYQAGETWSPDGCNTCTCQDDGSAVCTDILCTDPEWDCMYLGEYYIGGQSFPAIDGCNTCTCDEEGGLGCTEIFCANGCELQGGVIPDGATVPIGDGCNTCTCGGGSLSCTASVCACDGTEYWRDYVSLDPAECALIDFACSDPLQGFYNECGCGCAQDLALCGPVVPPSLAGQCPLSMVDPS